MSPPDTVGAGGVLTFWTRTLYGTYPDRLQVWQSPNGSGTNVADFTILLLNINPSLTTTNYPTVWTQFVVKTQGPAAVGRIAFRYFVTNGGPSGVNSDYIGIDTVRYRKGSGAACSAVNMLLLPLSGPFRPAQSRF